jgi:hypothetical protein
MTVTLPSGAELTIQLAPFTDAKALYQAFLEDIKALKWDAGTEMDTNFIKDILCVGLASKKFETCLWKCMERALYGGSKISPATFEAEEARQDYVSVCFEVAKENIMPFMKALMPLLSRAREILGQNQA